MPDDVPAKPLFLYVVNVVDFGGGTDGLGVGFSFKSRSKIGEAHGQGNEQVEQGHPGPSKLSKLPHVNALVAHDNVAIFWAAFVPTGRNVNSLPEGGEIALNVVIHFSEGDEVEQFSDELLKGIVNLFYDAKTREFLFNISD